MFMQAVSLTSAGAAQTISLAQQLEQVARLQEVGIMHKYTPRDWYWLVGGDATRAWSSASGSYVTQWHTERVTQIDTAESLNDVLRPYGLDLPAPTYADYAAAIQGHIDATSRAKDYADGFALASYVNSTIPAWAEEATAFVAWRDQVWVYAYTELAKVQAGVRPQPTIKDLIAERPAITWPA
jgi:hypothetical protein